MIVVHYLNNSRAQRIIWMLEEIGVDYRVELYERQARSNLAPRSLKAVHPLGKSPVIVDGAQTLAESGAIVEYLAETYASESMIPQDPEGRALCRYWLHFAEGSLAPPLTTRYIFHVASSKLPFFARPLLMLVPKAIEAAYLNPTIESLFAFVEDHLRTNKFMVGDRLSAADIMMSFPLEAALRGRAEVGPHIRDYVERLHARPAYRAALRAPGIAYKYA